MPPGAVSIINGVSYWRPDVKGMDNLITGYYLL